MNNTHLDQARAWARDNIDDFYEGQRVYAACEVIQSLPDQWIDADKVREVISEVLASTLPGTVGHQVAEDYAALIGELIPAPSLPTLADMTPEERQSCRWMQAELRINTTRSPMDCVIAVPGRSGGHVRVWHEDGGSMDVPANEVTPLSDLPRLEWPGQEAPTEETRPAETLNNPSSDHSADLPRPEDVPAGEAWLILRNGHEWVGARDSRDGANYPWALARLDGLSVDSAEDSEIDTLVSRLVPEVAP